MISRDQMLAPVFYPFDRFSQFQRGKTDQHIFRIKLAANAEAAADMALEQLHGFSFTPEQLRELIAIPMRHLGGAVHFQNVIRLVVARDGAARFERHARVAADGKLKRDNGMRSAESGVEIAEALAHDARLGAAFIVVEARLLCRVERRSLLFDRNLDKLGG